MIYALVIVQKHFAPIRAIRIREESKEFAMEPTEMTTLPPEQVAQLIRQWPPEKIESRCGEFLPEQILTAVAILDATHDSAWRDKLKALIKGLTEYPKLEAVGKALSFHQAQEIFDAEGIVDKSEAWKLSPLFVGMSHPVFTQFLHSANQNQIDLFKKEVINEPLQHHLTVLTHEILHHLPLHAEALNNLEQLIELLEVRQLTKEELFFILNGIHHSKEGYEAALDKINKMLTLAWNTSRADLIDKLSVAKEQCQKFLNIIIGHPRSFSNPATGLYGKLEARLHAVFGNAGDPNDIEALSDDEPALEALAKFSVWYLKDYWEIGLLPMIMDPLVFDHLDKAQNKKIELMEIVKHNLQRLGLNNVADLKKAGIYSRKLLKDYIESHKASLKK